MQIVSRPVILDALKAECDLAGSISEYARRIGVSPQYLNGILNNGKLPSKKVLGPLGYAEITAYYKVKV